MHWMTLLNFSLPVIPTERSDEESPLMYYNPKS